MLEIPLPMNFQCLGYIPASRLIWRFVSLLSIVFSCLIEYQLGLLAPGLCLNISWASLLAGASYNKCNRIQYV